MVVDDSPVMRIMLHEMLISLGHQVVAEASNGTEALEAYEEHKPELVALDISLPDMDGLKVLQRLLRADPDAKVMIVTGNDQRAVERRAVALRALGVVHKPFDPEELARVIEKAKTGIQRPDA